MKNLLPTKKQQGAFTLIELLVVIAIIAILASILFPVFAQARGNARRATSLSNLKQLALAFTMYTQDYDESLPNSRSFPPSARYPCQVVPYTKSGAVFFSPQNSNSYTDTVGRVNSECKAGDFSLPVYTFSVWPDYGYNMQYLAAGTPFTTTGIQRLAAVNSPSETILVASSAFQDWTSYGIHYINPPSSWSGWSGSGQPLSPDNVGKVSPRYVGGTVAIAFVDGHVKAMRLPALRGPEPDASATLDQKRASHDQLWDLN